MGYGLLQTKTGVFVRRHPEYATQPHPDQYMPIAINRINYRVG